MFNIERDNDMKLDLSKGLPDLTTDEIIQIGIDCFNLRHSTEMSDISNEMMEYNDPGNILLRWLNFFDFYHRAPTNSALRQRVEEKIKESFGDDSDAEDVIRLVTFERGIPQINLFYLGYQYKNLYPEKQKGIFGFSFGGHENQKSAEELIEASKKYYGRQSWIKLYLVYKGLPKDNGVLAVNIRNFFTAHFHEPFDSVVENLELDSYTDNDVKIPDEMPKVLSLPEEAEEQFLRLQAEHLFRRNDINLNLIEEFGVFWANRSLYLRIATTGGATICVPVVAGIFLTANVYALIGLGIALGGGLFVFELVGTTALKFQAQKIPESAYEIMKGQFISSSRTNKLLTELYGKQKEISEEQNKQLNTLATTNENLASKVSLLYDVATVLVKSTGQQKSIANTMENLLTGMGETKTELAEENQKLKETVGDLKDEISTLKEHDKLLVSTLQELKGVITTFKGTQEDINLMTRLFQSLVTQASIEPPNDQIAYHELEGRKCEKNEYVEAAERLYFQRNPEEAVVFEF